MRGRTIRLHPEGQEFLSTRAEDLLGSRPRLDKVRVEKKFEVGIFGFFIVADFLVAEPMASAKRGA
jgi:hypothetical protein